MVAQSRRRLSSGRERIAAVEETMTILRRLWAGDAVDHPVVGAALIGDADTLAARIAAYAEAGATDLTLGFSDFPRTAMLEAFAARVLGALRHTTAP